MPKISPEIAFIVALIALVGVLIKTLVDVYIARKRGDTDEKLVALKTELERKNAEALETVRTDFAARLARLAHVHSVELERVKMSPERLRLLLPKLEEFRGRLQDPRLNAFLNLAHLHKAGVFNPIGASPEQMQALPDSLDAHAEIKRLYVTDYRAYFLSNYVEPVDLAARHVEEVADRLQVVHRSGNEDEKFMATGNLLMALMAFTENLSNSLDAQVRELRTI
ncbi:hypothetical protein [Accumulibacter sp.]|jgi:hypothetical protein|uniref:Uncharacterized protein n=1 Tax=Accumulibacter regalis TaxID=522306 RepID=C7RJW4_ACCRE|nr:hypothetical protein [Accumulibacter sp.]MBN8499340.1 hypothetical protein [Accumulibacter sp.]MBO3716750.1 hypothetical protein [Accumulibacter sp.]